MANPCPVLFHTSHPGLAAGLRRDPLWTQVSAVLCAEGKSRSQATLAARALGRVETVKPDRVPLQAQDLAARPDLILCAHSFRILPPWAVASARLRAIGYHPSLLPAFKGRHAVEDALRAGVSGTGGSVYWLTDQIDGGPVVVAGGQRLQRAVQVLPGEDAGALWRRALAPLGRELLVAAVAGLLAH